jgi:hypothetical protein
LLILNCLFIMKENAKKEYRCCACSVVQLIFKGLWIIRNYCVQLQPVYVRATIACASFNAVVFVSLARELQLISLHFPTCLILSCYSQSALHYWTYINQTNQYMYLSAYGHRVGHDLLKENSNIQLFRIIYYESVWFSDKNNDINTYSTWSFYLFLSIFFPAIYILIGKLVDMSLFSLQIYNGKLNKDKDCAVEPFDLHF